MKNKTILIILGICLVSLASAGIIGILSYEDIDLTKADYTDEEVKIINEREILLNPVIVKPIVDDYVPPIEYDCLLNGKVYPDLIKVFPQCKDKVVRK